MRIKGRVNNRCWNLIGWDGYDYFIARRNLTKRQAQEISIDYGNLEPCLDSDLWVYDLEIAS